MFRRVEAALLLAGQCERYYEKFKEQEMEDSLVEKCVQDPSLTPMLQEIIPILGHRVNFISAFRQQGQGQEESSSGPSIRVEQKLTEILTEKQDLVKNTPALQKPGPSNSVDKEAEEKIKSAIAPIEKSPSQQNASPAAHIQAPESEVASSKLNVKKCFEIYKKKVKRGLKQYSTQFLAPANFQQLHTEALAAANQSLQQQALDSGSTSSELEAAQQELSSKVMSIFAENLEKNSSLVETTIKNATEKAIKQFRLVWDTNNAPGEYIDENGLDENLNFAQQEAVRVFQNCLNDTDLVSILQKIQKNSLNDPLTTRMRDIRKWHEDRKSEAETKMATCLKEIEEIYGSQINLEMTDKIFSNQQLTKIHDRLVQNQLTTLQKKLTKEKKWSKKYSDLILQKCGDHIAANIWLQIFKKNGDARELFKSKAMNWVTECGTEYYADLRKIIKENDEESKILKIEKNLRAEGFKKLEKKLNHFHPNDEEMAQFVESMRQKFETSLNTTLDYGLNFLKKRQLQDDLQVKETLNSVSKFYNEEMDKVLKSKPFFHPDDLLKLHTKISKAALQADINQNLALMSETQKPKLKQAMVRLFGKYEEENLRKIPQDSVAVGIDLGTTTSCVAIYHDGQVTVIRNESESSSTTTPSIVAFDPSGKQCVVGEMAKRQCARNPLNTIYNVKRIIGQKFSDPGVQEDVKKWHFSVVNQGNDRPGIRVRDKVFSPEEISARVLHKMKEIAEFYLQKKACVKNVVITVPANFNDGQRQATKHAAEIAGLNVLKIINEPTAAALAHHHIFLRRHNDGLSRNVLVFDLGGGTFDVSLVTIDGGNIEVKATHGDMHLGGDDFDHELAKYCIQQVKGKYFFDLSAGSDSKFHNERLNAACNLRRLLNECEKCKCNLSAQNCFSTNAEIEGLAGWNPARHGGSQGSRRLCIPLTRELFNRLNAARFSRCMDIVASVLNAGQIDRGQVQDIVLVGGSTRIPKIREMLQQFFENKELSIHKEFNPDEAVAYGAAILAAKLNGEAVVAAGRLGGSQSTVLLNELRFTDVTPLPIGIKVLEGHLADRLSVIIPRNSKVPCSMTNRHYSTARDDQTLCEIVIFEGDDPVASRNSLLGTFLLSGIPPGRAGEHSLSVTMSVTDEGILHVSAICESNSSRSEVTISEFKGRMTKNEIEVAKNLIQVETNGWVKS